MAGERIRRRLGDLVAVKHGFAFQGEYFCDEPTGLVLVTPGSFEIGGGFKSDKPKFYEGPVPAGFLLEEGDLIVTMTDLSKGGDTLGFPAIVPRSHGLRYLHNQRIGRVEVTAPQDLDRHYLYYVLCSESYRHEVLASATGSTVRHTSPSRIGAFMFEVPQLAEQQAVAEVLGALDDKIDLNHRMNETLEAMARVLFKSWFVDFDPVRAKAEGRAPAGMDAATAALFPSGFEADVPAGWTRSTVGDLAQLERGSTYKSSLKGNAGPYLLGLGSIQRNGGFRGDKLVQYGGESPPRMLLGPGDLFVSLKDVTQSADLLGAVARVPSYVKQGRLTQDTVKLVLRDGGETASVLYRTLLTPEYREYCRAHATGTTNLGLGRDDFLSFPVVLPDAPLLKYSNSVLEALDLRMDAAVVENMTLAEIRSALLPKLLTGELRVREAEAAVGQVV